MEPSTADLFGVDAHHAMSRGGDPRIHREFEGVEKFAEPLDFVGGALDDDTPDLAMVRRPAVDLIGHCGSEHGGCEFGALCGAHHQSATVHDMVDGEHIGSSRDRDSQPSHRGRSEEFPAGRVIEDLDPMGASRGWS
jgi:hypothetical protein